MRAIARTTAHIRSYQSRLHECCDVAVGSALARTTQVSLFWGDVAAVVFVMEVIEINVRTKLIFRGPGPEGRSIRISSDFPILLSVI